MTLLRREVEILGVKVLNGIALSVFTDKIESNGKIGLQLSQGFHLQIVQMSLSQRCENQLKFILASVMKSLQHLTYFKLS